jgi:hypothetical protein
MAHPQSLAPHAKGWGGALFPQRGLCVSQLINACNKIRSWPFYILPTKAVPTPAKIPSAVTAANTRAAVFHDIVRPTISMGYTLNAPSVHSNTTT